MENEQPIKKPFEIITNWAALCLSQIALGVIGCIPRDRMIFYGILKDFGSDPPALTKLVFSIPDFVFPVAAAMVAMISIAVQLITRSKNTVTIFHLVILMFCLAFLMAYREAMLMPVINLMRDVQASGAKR